MAAIQTMFAFLRSLLPKAAAAQSQAAVPDGERVYAIGDIHGRSDLLAALKALIEADDASARPARTTVILLGDLIDRGPDSAGVVALAREWQAQRDVRILAGNHEEMFLKSFDNSDILRHFLRHGGRETLFSYGVDRQAYNAASIEEVRALMQEAVPQEERAFLEGFEDQIAIGDYLFVHAGVDPAKPLDEQTTADLRWIREPFLSHPDSFGPIVVHGHTIADAPVVTATRIGIDTGAYASGRLTAVVLEGRSRRFLEAVIAPDENNPGG